MQPQTGNDATEAERPVSEENNENDATEETMKAQRPETFDERKKAERF